MNIRDNVRTDLRLRNSTIYAQWASVLAAMLLYLIAIPVFLSFIIFLLSLASSYTHVELSWVLLYALDATTPLYPLASLALDLPQYIRRKSLLYTSTVSWFAIPLRHFISLFTYGFIKVQVVELIIPASLFVVTYLFAGRIWMTGSLGLGTRVGVNILYCGQLLFSAYTSHVACTRADNFWCMWFVLLVHYIAAGLFGVAALLYGFAWTMRHTWVSSRSLGGTGIEPMVLMLPVRGPLYQSVGNEAREGAIRLT